MSGVAGLLARMVAELDAARIPFMVTGSFASTAHGLPRTTQDLDLSLDRAYIERWVTRLGLRDEWEAAQKTSARRRG